VEQLKDTGKTFNGRRVFACKGALTAKDFFEAFGEKQPSIKREKKSKEE
jgi:S-adenosylmethionine hydrolase